MVIGAACTIIFLIAAAIWLFKEWCDPGYQAQQQWKRETQQRIDERERYQKSMKEKLLSEGWRTASYETCKATRERCIEQIRQEDPSAISQLPDGYLPSRKSIPRELIGYHFSDIEYCAGIYLFYQEKVIWESDLNFGPYPDIEENEKLLRWYQSVCRYALMSNKDFEKAVGRKLTYEELVDRRKLIDKMVPSFYSHSRQFATRAKPTVNQLVKCGTAGDEFYPLSGSPKYNQILYEFYGGDTGSTEDDFK